MMKCFSKLTYTMAAMSDLDFGLRIAQRATEYGVDGFSTPQVMAFGLELYEAGILTDQDMAGMPSSNEEKFYWLLDKIVRREGIGDVLANGTYWAAKQIGNGAEKFAHNNIKKHEQLPLKLSMLNPIYFLMYATGEKINITQIEGQFPQAPFPTREEREAFVKDWFQVPDEKLKIISWTGNCAEKSRCPITRRFKCAATLWTGKRECITSTMLSACAPVCRRFPETSIPYSQLPEVYLSRYRNRYG